MGALADIVVFISIMFLIVVCAGDPDIIDGWAKQANQVECKK